MFPSGAPSDHEAGPQQEGIWDAPDEAPTEPAVTSRSTPGGLGGRIAPTASLPGPAGLAYADVPNRILAMAVDLIVLSLTGFVLAWLLGGLVSQPGALDRAGGELDLAGFLLVMVLQLLISLAYFVGCWTVFSGTPGQRLLGMRVGEDVAGEPLARRAALIRWSLVGIPAMLATPALYVPDLIGVILSLLGVAWLTLLLYTIAQSPTKQGLHDRLAHSIVVRLRRRERQAEPRSQRRQG